MILELDLGNTRCKWRIVDGDAVIARGVGTIADWCAGVLPEWPAIERVRIASVLNESAENELASALKKIGAPIAFARSTASCAGVVNSYSEPQQLGVDRWLGMLAAYREFQSALIVVSAGTALTIDLVAADGCHRGGYIIPGARLMADALLRSTDRVRFDDAALLASFAPGKITGDCVHHGIVLALVGAIRLALAQVRQQAGDMALVLAGGDADALAILLPDESLHLRPEVVLDGLRWALP